MYIRFPHLVLPDNLTLIVGPPDLGTRIYRASGTDVQARVWHQAISDAFFNDRFISPGAVGLFAPVSRAAVHKRLNEGGLTLFLFHVLQIEHPLFRYQKKVKLRPYGFIPVSECRAWAAELYASPARRQFAATPAPAPAEDVFLD